MIVLLSPAKIQNFKPQHQVDEFSVPLYLEKSAKIISTLRKLSISEIAHLLNVNFNIAEKVQHQHLIWNQTHTRENSKQAACVFNGEAYRGLDISQFSAEDIRYAQVHFAILSGLYGILRPLDLIQPYRIDVGDDIADSLGMNLYSFWKKEVNRTIEAMFKNTPNESRIILNLMSKEYACLLDRKNLNAQIVDVEFLEYQPDTEKYKPIVIYIKKARGMMTRFVLKNRINNLEDVKLFSEEGYWYSEELSGINHLVFVR